MPDFTGRSAAARQNLAAQDDASSDARSQSDHHQILVALPRTSPLFSQCGDIGIIAYPNRQITQKLGKLFRYIENTPTKVHAGIDDSVFQNRSGNTHAGSFNVSGQGKIL